MRIKKLLSPPQPPSKGDIPENGTRIKKLLSPPQPPSKGDIPENGTR
ncbi:unnamed protein product [Acanthoscelides obtectus]|uniref:Uncharacterized protein n=1 Tax=Acanthoscelides obtectus TaxID=200917 RepID=A0A9P0M7P8_ACAOB|nr:unnamed protein product [Acanthoscelides obtectus]CAK1671574.1 hypothetical protein AOBTE_LOCUS28331 [Acanthoscelides obtectus]